ncbi:MAG: hypothetical protein U0527_17730 [Candidatus Eisenbacteria bacterium]
MQRTSTAPAKAPRALLRVAIALLLLAPAAARGAEWVRMDRAHYIGQVPTHGEVLFDLSRIVGERAASAHSVRHGIEIELHDCTGSVWPICVAETSGFAPAARWEGQLSPDESTFEGDWVPEDGSPRAPLRFERVAQERGLRADSLGFFLACPSVTAPWFARATEVNRALDAWAEERLTERRARPPSPESTESWSYEIEGIGHEILSLRYHVDRSDPLAGDSAAEDAVTFGWVGREFRPLAFHDLALAGSDLEAKLEALALAELAREGATDQSGKPLTSFGGRLAHWTAGPAGLTFRFAPLHLPSHGSSELERAFPEQLFALTLPYASFDALLDRSGPLREWLAPTR